MSEDNSELSYEEQEEKDSSISSNKSISNNNSENAQTNSNKITEEDLNIFNTKLHSIQKGINTLKSKFGSLIENMKQDDYELQYGLSFFEAKQDMMNMYITNLLNYCCAKINGEQSISGMELIKENIKIASLIERVKSESYRNEIATFNKQDNKYK